MLHRDTKHIVYDEKSFRVRSVSSTPTFTPGIHENVKSIRFDGYRENIMERYNICQTSNVTSKYSVVVDEDGKTKLIDSNGKGVGPEMVVYEIIEYNTIKYIIIDESLNGISKSVFHDLNRIKSNVDKLNSTKVFNTDKINENLQKVRKSMYSCLDDDLKLLVKMIHYGNLSELQFYIADQGGDVIFCNNEEIMWLEREEKVNFNAYNLIHDISNRNEYNKVFFVNQHKTIKIKDGKYLSNFIPTSCKFTYKFIKELTTRYQQENSVLRNIELFYDLIMELVNNPELFIYEATVRNYFTRDYYMAGFVNDQASKCNFIKIGTRIEYQFVVLREKLDEYGNIVEPKLWERMRLVSDHNIIDYGYYLRKLTPIYNAIDNKSVFSKKLNNPVKIMIDYFSKHGRFPDSNEFGVEIQKIIVS